MPEIIGFVYGEVRPTSFSILVENKKLAERGTYVKIHHEMYGWVLGQISFVRRFWDDKKGIEKIVADVRVIGYKDENGLIRLPKTPFKPEERVFKAHQTLIRRILGLEMPTNVGLYVGKLDGEDDLKVYLDANKLIQKHLCVLAKTGAGKSYTVGVLLEELADKEVPCVVVDPHGEYFTLKIANDSQSDFEKFTQFGVMPKGFSNVVEFTPNKTVNQTADFEFKLSDKNLSAREIIDILPTKLTSGQQALLYQAINELSPSGDYTLEYIIQHLQLSDTNAKWGLIASMQTLLDTNIFSDEGTNLGDIVKKGQTTIVNLKGIKPELQELVVSKLSTDLFEARKANKIPAFFFLVEEAHRFCPERGVGTALSLSILRTVAAEGRKFGMGLGIVSQRPAKVDKNVLSQCNTQIILKVTNPNDIMAISKSLENFTSELEEIMKNLPMGVAVITSEGLERPVLTNVRVRRSKHGGASVDLIKTRYPNNNRGYTPKANGESPGLVEKIKERLVGTESEARKDEAKKAVETMQERREEEIIKQQKADEWKENLTPDEIEFLEVMKPEGIRKKILRRVKNFFIAEASE
ncbi:MAG: ATP-binding protein [Candidatus Altiarchaeota archaeon]|nr:ATP-binding protein [Candidatus Altiarchaeota archaeon]